MTKKFYIKNHLDLKKKISTPHAVFSLIENIENTIDNKVFVSGIFVDLQKAFDTVDHNILLHKLSYYRKRIANC